MQYRIEYLVGAGERMETIQDSFTQALLFLLAYPVKSNAVISPIIERRKETRPSLLPISNRKSGYQLQQRRGRCKHRPRNTKGVASHEHEKRVA